MTPDEKRPRAEAAPDWEPFDPEAEFADLPEAARRGFADGRAVAEVGRMVRHFREAAGLTQGALADAIGTKQSSISEIERGIGPQGPTFTLLKRIIEACNFEIEIVAAPKSAGAQGPKAVRYKVVPTLAGPSLLTVRPLSEPKPWQASS